MLVKDLFISSLTIILYIIFSILSIEFSKNLKLFLVAIVGYDPTQ